MKSLKKNTKLEILSPVIRGKKGVHKGVFEEIKKEGFVRLRVDGQLYSIADIQKLNLDKNKKHYIEVVIDRLIMKGNVDSRLNESIELALKIGNGIVIIKDNAEIGSNNTIDRGSLGNTIIGENTFLDNQVHIAHNVKIGKNCIIAGQVGFAGSSEIGDNVLIGGQAGISGHLKIGNNVQIGGGSGVIKNIPDNTKVMGYPAKDIKLFLKENKK